MWTNNGTVTVTTGSRIVDGQGTQFVGPVIAGYALLTGDLRLYEIEAVESATRLRLVRPYQGGGAANVPYDVVPISPDITGVIERVQALIDRYQSFRDSVGQGMFPSGSAAAPGMRFIADQDTGITRSSENAISLVAGGVNRVTASADGLIVAGNVAASSGARIGYSVGETWALAGDQIGHYGMTVGVALGGGDPKTVVCGYAGLILAAGGAEQARITPGGNVGIGVAGPGSWRLNVSQKGPDLIQLTNSLGTGVRINMNDQAWGAQIEHNGGNLIFRTGGTSEAVRVDANKNLLVGTTTGGNHRILKAVGEGVTVLSIGNDTTNFVFFNSVASQQWSNASTAMSLGRHSGNGRSLNAGGTINANGADYAEYMLKAAGCGIIAKGDVCGVDRDGRLTKTWADAISFVVKSTDPSYVGGDTWAAHLPPRPDAPGAEPQPPALPTVPAEDADDAEVATYRDALAAYPALVAQYQVDHDAWAAATVAYERDLPAWEAELEAARVCVDRIAFCGQVPCNVSGDFEVGDYIVPAANGGGIKAVAMKLDDMTLAQYARRIGKVWAIRDGRAWIDVQHG